MQPDPETFLAEYDNIVFEHAMHLRKVLYDNLPGVTEQVDIPAKMIAFCYGRQYAELVCTIFPSGKGLKIGFNRGTEFPDPKGLLEGTGKISRYVVIKSKEMIDSDALQDLIRHAFKAYKERMSII